MRAVVGLAVILLSELNHGVIKYKDIAGSVTGADADTGSHNLVVIGDVPQALLDRLPEFSGADAGHTIYLPSVARERTYIADRREGGDRFWLQVKDKDGNIVADLSRDDPATDIAVTIDSASGDIVVPGSTASAKILDPQPGSIFLPMVTHDEQSTGQSLDDPFSSEDGAQGAGAGIVDETGAAPNSRFDRNKSSDNYDITHFR